MDKLKRVWRENKVLFVLAIILVICLGVLVSVAVIYGYGTNDSNYETPAKLSESVLSKVKSKLESNENVLNANVKLKRKTVYIEIKYNETTSLEDAKVIAASVVELFTEKDLKTADLSFAISKDGSDKFTLWGSKNTHGSGDIVWGNHNIKTTEEKETE